MNLHFDDRPITTRSSPFALLGLVAGLCAYVCLR